MSVAAVRRRRRSVLAALGIAVLTTACSGVPTNSDPVAAPASIERQLPTVTGTNTQAPVARRGMSARQVVSSFIDASAQPGGSHDAAKSFMTKSAQSEWNDDKGATVARQIFYVGSLDLHSHTVDVQFTQAGKLDENGTYTVTPSDNDFQTMHFHLQRDAKNKTWQISEPPGPGILIRLAQFDQNYMPINLYFLNRAQDPRVVPDPRYFPRAPSSLADLVARALVAGPSNRLRPAVETAIPPTAGLAGSVLATKSPLQINLHGISGLTQTQLHSLAAQFVWTMDQLRTVLQVERLQLLSDGTVVSITGFGTQPLSKDSWLSYDPEAIPAGVATPYVIQDGDVVRTSDSTRVPGASGYGLSSVTVSADGKYLAGVARERHGATLYVGKYGARLRAVLGAKELTPPTWLSDDQLLVVKNRRSLVRFPAASPAGQPVSYGLGSIPGVRSLQVSLDGTRVALVSLSGVVYTGVVGDTTPIVGLRPLADAPGDALQVAWSGATEVTILAPDAQQGLPMTVWTMKLDSDGGRQSLATTGLPDSPVAMTAAPNQYTIVQPRGQATPYYYDGDKQSWAELESNDNLPVVGTAPSWPG